MKKIKKLPLPTDVDKYVMCDKINELADAFNSHQEEHDKNHYAIIDKPEETDIEQDQEEHDKCLGDVYEEAHKEMFGQPKEVSEKSGQMKTEKIAEIIKDYAHDYRDIALDEEHLRVMLQDFHTAILEEEK